MSKYIISFLTSPRKEEANYYIENRAYKGKFSTIALIEHYKNECIHILFVPKNADKNAKKYFLNSDMVDLEFVSYAKEEQDQPNIERMVAEIFYYLLNKINVESVEEVIVDISHGANVHIISLIIALNLFKQYVYLKLRDTKFFKFKIYFVYAAQIANNEYKIINLPEIGLGIPKLPDIKKDENENVKKLMISTRYVVIAISLGLFLPTILLMNKYKHVLSNVDPIQILSNKINELYSSTNKKVKNLFSTIFSIIYHPLLKKFEEIRVHDSFDEVYGDIVYINLEDIKRLINYLNKEYKSITLLTGFTNNEISAIMYHYKDKIKTNWQKYYIIRGEEKREDVNQGINVRNFVAHGGFLKFDILLKKDGNKIFVGYSKSFLKEIEKIMNKKLKDYLTGYGAARI